MYFLLFTFLLARFSSLKNGYAMHMNFGKIYSKRYFFNFSNLSKKGSFFFSKNPFIFAGHHSAARARGLGRSPDEHRVVRPRRRRRPPHHVQGDGEPPPHPSLALGRARPAGGGGEGGAKVLLAQHQEIGHQQVSSSLKVFFFSFQFRIFLSYQGLPDPVRVRRRRHGICQLHLDQDRADHVRQGVLRPGGKILKNEKIII